MPNEKAEKKETERKLKFDQWVICPKCEKRYKASNGHKCREEK